VLPSSALLKDDSSPTGHGPNDITDARKSCCVYVHSLPFSKIHNMSAFNCDKCCQLALCLKVILSAKDKAQMLIPMPEKAAVFISIHHHYAQNVSL
jgi:hypothetical protein